MTDTDRKKLDEALDTFEKFMDFVKFTNDHNIIFNLEEWEEYRDLVLARVPSCDEATTLTISLDGLIVP